MNSENKDIFYDDMQLLDKEIRTGNNAFQFLVFTDEASSGKTQQIIKSAINSGREMLIVTKFMEEVNRIVRDINKGAGFIKAVGIVSDVELIKENPNLVLTAKNIEFYSRSIIVITHAQYYKICTGENGRLESMVKDFNTLIIDEEFNHIKNNLYTFSIAKNLQMINVFTSFGMGEDLKELTFKLVSEFENIKYKPTNRLHWVEIEECKLYAEIKSNTIREVIKKHESNIHIKLADYKTNTGVSYSIKDLIDYIDLVEKIFKNTIEGYSLISVSEKIITTYDYKFEYFKLQNNIILDASAKFAKIYDSFMFDVVDTTRKINHSNCKITVVKIPTTTSGKAKINHLFRPKFKNYVVKMLGATEKGLVVTKKDESNYLEKVNFKDFDKEIKDEIELINSDLFEESIDYEERIGFRNYENQRGRNDYADYKHVFLAHTYRQPPQYYIFTYRYFFGEKATPEEMVTSYKKDKNGNKRWTFHASETLDRLMFTDMVGSQYQTLKRVERNREPKAHYHFFTTDLQVVKATLDELYRIDYKNNLTVLQEIDFLGERVSKRSKEDILKDYIEEKLAQGKWEAIKSSDLKDELKINNRSWMEIWKSEEFLNFCKEKRIKEGKKKGMKVNHVYKY